MRLRTPLFFAQHGLGCRIPAEIQKISVNRTGPASEKGRGYVHFAAGGGC